MLTFCGSGLSGKRVAATRKQSGAGLPCLTWSSSELKTAWWNNENSSVWRDVFNWYEALSDPVARQMGML